MSPLRILAALGLLALACADPPPPQAPPPRSGQPQSEQEQQPQVAPVHKAPPPEYGDRVVESPKAESVDEERARQIARQEGAKAGYELSDYALASTRREGRSYWVRFQLHPPGRPGGHFSVEVDSRTGNARVVPGR